MTKAQLIEAVASELDKPKKTVGEILDVAFDHIARSIKKEKRFWVPGFGTFSVRRRKARKGFNPASKEHISIPAARTVGFRAAPELKKGL